MKLNLSATRIKALIKKEVLQIKRDKSAILIAFALPVFLTFIFGYAISIDTNKVRIAIVNEDSQSSASSDLISFFSSSKFINVKAIVSSQNEAEQKILSQKVSAILFIPSDFSKKLTKKKTALVYLASDGSDPNTASFCTSYVQNIMSVYADYLNLKKGLKIKPQINIEQRFWYNEALKADHLLNIGSIGFVLSIAGTLLTALVVARDWERGSMEYLIAAPVTTHEIILGKILPYLVLGLGSFFISFACVMIFFGTPFKGSILIFGVIGLLYLILTTGLGLLISTASKSQFVASQGAILVSMVPTIMLSGLIYEIETMPKIMQIITNIVPAKYLINAMKTLFLMGNDWAILLPNILGILAIISAIYFGVLRKTKKTID
ncbi:MAG: ABC transporter permease [Proteobacteria bacterium]|nr:ABC transporter permease [Pseudomonadota bacterium]